MQGLGGGDGQAARAQRGALERRVRVAVAFENEDVEAGEREFAGQEEADGAGAGDEDVVEMLVGHGV